MKHLPYIDEQARTVGASPERTWTAVLAVSGSFAKGDGGPVARLLGVRPARTAGDWSAEPAVGATLPGFAIEEARRPSRLALAGRHRFSRYALVFELEPIGDAWTRIRALTWAAFPGPHGRAYRALVIGSGAHRVVVRHLLRRIEVRACWV